MGSNVSVEVSREVTRQGIKHAHERERAALRAFIKARRQYRENRRNEEPFGPSWKAYSEAARIGSQAIEYRRMWEAKR